VFRDQAFNKLAFFFIRLATVYYHIEIQLEVSHVLRNLSQNKPIPRCYRDLYLGVQRYIESISHLPHKDYYQKGETAQLTFNWTASADGFPNSRLGRTKLNNVKVVASIKDAQGKDCAQPITQEIKEDNQMDNISIPISITNDCLNPVGIVRVETADGKVLDLQKFQLTSKKIAQKQPVEKTQTNSSKNKWLIISLIVVILILGLVVVFLKKRTGKILGVIILFLLAGSMLVIPRGVKAKTFNMSSVMSAAPHHIWIIY